MVQHRNLEHIAQLLQQRAVSLRRWSLGLDVLLGALLAALPVSLLLMTFSWPVSRLTVYGGIALLAAGIFALLAWRIRVHVPELLAQADRVLGLHETLSTADEYRQQYAANPFVPGLLAMADRLAPRVEVRRVLPRPIPRRLWAVPLLLVAIVSSFTLKLAPRPFEDFATQEVARDISREGQRLEKWGRELEELARREQLDRSKILARQMQQLGQRLQREGGEKAHVAEHIATLSQYLQRLQQELRERALMGEAVGPSAQDVLMSDKNVKQELRDILHLLQNDAAPRDMAAAAEQSILRLSRQVGQNAQLENLLNNLRAGDLEAARRLLQEALQQQQAAEEVEHLDRARRALEYSSRAIQRGAQPDASHGHTRPQQHERATQMPGEPGEEGLYADEMSGMDDFSGTGAEEGHGSSTLTRQQSEPGMRESDQPLSNVEVKNSEGARRLSYVRSLPLQNEAHVPFEQAVVQYQHAAEDVLTQERIPPGYREQIKQYFLSLGMMK